jgi:hypothetical protein
MKRSLVLGLALLALSTTPVLAWNMLGHHRVTEAAVLALPDEVPEFFRWGAATVAHTGIDPDVMRHRQAPQLRNREYPEHFLDFELVDISPLPEMRYRFLALLTEKGLAPDRVGFSPYVVSENAQRLSLAFAEHRCWPENPHIRSKTLVYAGLLAHYATDMNQPLHTSVHYDGRANDNGDSPRTGIHRRMDSLFEQPGFEPGDHSIEPQGLGEIWPAVSQEFAASHSKVDTVYALEADLEALHEQGEWSPELAAFAEDRYRSTIEFLSSLYLTAWRLSAEIELSQWAMREGPGGGFEACKAASPHPAAAPGE